VEYHTYCLDPPLSEIPLGSWYCKMCEESGLGAESVSGAEEEGSTTGIVDDGKLKGKYASEAFEASESAATTGDVVPSSGENR
jgi:hypothetical protein